jgi:cytochrome P450
VGVSDLHLISSPRTRPLTFKSPSANSNSIPAVFWSLYEVFRDPFLLSRIRREVDAARLPSADPNVLPHYDLNVLSKLPLLQSVYAEVLRLRTAVLVTRTPERKDFSLGNWIFQKDKLVMASSYTAHHDGNIWNAGTPDDPHPLNEFWAERFLIYPNEPNSGPLRHTKAQHKTATPANPNTSELPDIAEEEEKGREPKFSTDGLAGAWIPYGGGQTLCPGRHYAKQEMLGTLAFFGDSM